MPVLISSGVPMVAPLAPAAGTGKAAAGPSFGSVLSDAVAAVEQRRGDAQGAMQRFLSGENEDLHKVALAGQRAELASEMFLQVRNKVVSAYQEIMRMQL